MKKTNSIIKLTITLCLLAGFASTSFAAEPECKWPEHANKNYCQR